MIHRLKRWLYLAHRWIGIAACLLFAMWFASGLVMIYVPFPNLSRAERLAGLPPIDWLHVHVAPAEALRGAELDAPPRGIALEMRADRPVWRIRPSAGDEIDIAAADGHRLGGTDAREARRAAEVFSGRRAVAVSSIFNDQWTVAGTFDRHRPLWKVDLAGDGGRVLYVSSHTGAVMLDTYAHERFWNWLGSVPHWLYPTVVRQNNPAWRQVVMWVSGPCIVAAVTGIWIGILRTRLGQRRFKRGRIMPYHGWMHWHHLAGLLGGLFLLGWIFSGWLSVDPFRLFFAGGGITPAARASYESAGAPPPITPDRLAAATEGARRVELRWVAGRALYAAEGASAAPPLIDARSLAPVDFTDPELIRVAARLIPGERIAAADRLTEPDNYWYEVGAPPLLPVLRVRFADPARTWVHIDPRTGAILGSIDVRGRLYRWLFDLLHKWDLNLLTANRPAWDGLLWLFSIAGLVTSISGIRIGWKRLTGRRPARARSGLTPAKRPLPIPAGHRPPK